MTNLVVVSAGTGIPSLSTKLADRLADATVRGLGGEVQVKHLELRTLARDLADALVGGVRSAALREAFDTLCTADGVIAVTPVYNASYSGLFKLFFDMVDRETLRGRPVLIGANGGSARHSLMLDTAMLPLFHYLKAFVAPTSVFAATEDWADEYLAPRIERAGTEFAAFMRAHPAPAPEDPFAVADFSTLLGN